MLFIFEQVTPERCLSLSIQLIDVIELYLETDNISCVRQFQICLMSLVHSLIEFGYDPRNAIRVIWRTVQQSNPQIIDDDITDYILITMSQIVHVIAPLYLGNALEIVKVLLKIIFIEFPIHSKNVKFIP